MISLGRNISALKAQRELETSTSGVGKVYERLASGQRINTASDDAAGLAIADSLRSNSRVFSRGLKNINDGVSALNIMESAVQALQGIIIRQTELAEQSANGTYSTLQRKPIDAEARELTKEYNRIVESTTFNGVKLLENPYSEISIQAGYGTDAILKSNAAAAFGRVAGDGTASAITTLTGGGNHNNLISVDVNNDGHMDLLGSSFFPELNINNGDGTYSYSVLDKGVVGIGLAETGDFNNDGNADFVFIDDSAANASIILGRGDGTFTTSRSFTLGGASGNFMTAGDFNGDGILDLAATSFSGGTFVAIGSGDGTFAAQVTVASTAAGFGITSADFDGDGKDEILENSSSGLNMYSINNTGTFQSTNIISASTFSSRVSTGDFNGDGIKDFVGLEIIGGIQQLACGIGKGDGTFTISYQANNDYVQSIAVGDLNGDGIDDLATSRYAPTIATYISTGNGTFGDVKYSTVATTSTAVSIADFNNDGISEIAVGNSYSAPKLSIWSQNTTLSSDGQFLDLQTVEGARAALTTLAASRQRLSGAIGAIGAVQSRMNVAYNTLEVQTEQTQAAESRIRDVDVANESANLVRLQILQRAASSVLGQANQAPALALRLLS